MKSWLHHKVVGFEDEVFQYTKIHVDNITEKKKPIKHVWGYDNMEMECIRSAWSFIKTAKKNEVR